LGVLDLAPVWGPAGAIGSVTAFRYQTLQPHPTGRSKQIGTDLALFERRNEDAVRSAGLAGDQVDVQRDPPNSLIR
jgi:hypothetical protein